MQVSRSQGDQRAVRLPVLRDFPGQLAPVVALGALGGETPVGFRQPGLAKDLARLVGLSVFLEADLPAHLGMAQSVAGGDPAEEAGTNPEAGQLRRDPEAVFGVGDGPLDELRPGQLAEA